MAARIRRPHQAEVREKIRASQLVNRLEDHALGKIDLEQTQVQAIKILLGKVIPDLTAISGDPNGEPVRTSVTVEFIKP